MLNDLQTLQQIGLSEKEARVYIAALSLGPATADQLAKQTGINRSTTYVHIKSLMAMGLMSTYEEGKKIGWKDGFRAIYCILKYNL